jgi:hypothetical protein
MVASGATRVVAQLTSLLLVAGGAYLAYGEALPFFRGGVLAKERFDALYNRSISPGLSTASKRLVLDNCVDAITSIYGRTQPPDRRKVVSEACLHVADTATAADPAFSYAWFVGGLAAERLGDLEGMAGRLAQSARVGSNEQWIAELRWPLFEQHYDALPEAARPLVEHDMLILLDDIDGSVLVADRYVRGDAPFKARVEATVEKTRETIQQRFLNNVKASLRQVQ